MKNIDIIVQSIISHQEEVLGPLALEQAKGIAGLEVNSDGKVKISLKKEADSKDLLADLVKKYEKLFGRASVEVCKDAVKESGVKYADSDLPEILQ
jgi:hypothetical protein